MSNLADTERSEAAMATFYERDRFAETRVKQWPTIHAWMDRHEGHDWGEQECQGGTLLTCYACDDNLWVN